VRPGHVIEGSLTDRTLDLLSIEGGWWRGDEIATRLDAEHRSVDKALYRALARGLVCRRYTYDGRTPEWAA